MKKKRIANIINPKGVDSERLERMENRILRGVDQGIDSLKDQISDLEERSEQIIDSLGGFNATAEGTKNLQSSFQRYCENEEKLLTLKHYVEHLTGLKNKLLEEIEITPMPVTQVQVVTNEK